MNLLDMLIINQKLPIGTIITLVVPSVSMVGTKIHSQKEMVLSKIIPHHDKSILELKDHNQTWAIATSHNIKYIDGMTLERYAELFDINSDGSSKRTGRKRGRKTNKEKMMMN